MYLDYGNGSITISTYFKRSSIIPYYEDNHLYLRIFIYITHQTINQMNVSRLTLNI